MINTITADQATEDYLDTLADTDYCADCGGTTTIFEIQEVGGSDDQPDTYHAIVYRCGHDSIVDKYDDALVWYEGYAEGDAA